MINIGQQIDLRAGSAQGFFLLKENVFLQLVSLEVRPKVSGKSHKSTNYLRILSEIMAIAIFSIGLVLEKSNLQYQKEFFVKIKLKRNLNI